MRKIINQDEHHFGPQSLAEYGIAGYKRAARETAVYDFSDYPLAALAEEVGEVMGKIAKFGRKNGLPIHMVIECVSNPGCEEQRKLREEVSKEMGDVIWQWVNLCHELNLNPAQVMADNIEKLQGRKERGTLEGSGDER